MRHAWTVTNQANVLCNLMCTGSLCMCRSDGSSDSVGETIFCNFDCATLVDGRHRPVELFTSRLYPDLIRGASEPKGALQSAYLSRA